MIIMEIDLLAEENEALQVQNLQHLNTIRDLLNQIACLMDANARLTETINTLISESE